MKLIAILITFFLTFPLFGQNLENNTPIEQDGFSIKYKIINHRVKSTRKHGDLERYEIEFFITNKTGKDIIMRNKSYNSTLFASNENYPLDLVSFNCINALGVRLTSKEITLEMKQSSISYTYDTYNSDGKSVVVTDNVITGVEFKNNAIISDGATFLLKKGEKPEINFEFTFN